MAIHAISDLHLALSIDKPMDVFGDRWSNYMERLKDSWEHCVDREDYVLIPGDVSWATYLEQAYEDLKFIDDLPGIKIISKGNHDYWWTTMNKLQKYVEDNRFSTIKFLHNNSLRAGNVVICGTRGWKCPGEDDFTQEDRKIYERELIRLDLSLKSAGNNNEDILVAMLHYPPFNSRREPSEFVDILLKYKVKICLYGHLHGESTRGAFNGMIEETDFKLVSADYLGFTPLKIF